MAPPDKFQDPDVDMHKRLDLRNSDQAPGGMDVNDLNADINDRDGDGLDDNTGEPIQQEDELGADDNQPMLTCPNCGFEAPASEPMSISTEEPDPELAPEQNAEGAAVAGDPCPNCGEAPLMSADEMAEAGMVPPEQEEEPAPVDEEEQAFEEEPLDDEQLNEEREREDPFSEKDEEDDEEEEDEDEPVRKGGFPPKK